MRIKIAADKGFVGDVIIQFMTFFILLRANLHLITLQL